MRKASFLLFVLSAVWVGYKNRLILKKRVCKGGGDHSVNESMTFLHWSIDYLSSC